MIDIQHHYCASFREPNVFMAAFAGRAASAHIRQMHQDLKAAGQRGNLVVLVVIEHRATLGKRGRAAIAEMMSEANGYVRAWAVVVEGEGLWVTSSRAIASLVMSSARHTYPTWVTATVEGAIKVLAPYGVEAADAQRLMRPPASTFSTSPSPAALPRTSSSTSSSSTSSSTSRTSSALKIEVVTLTGKLTADSLEATMATVPIRDEAVGLIMDARTMSDYDKSAREYFVAWNRERLGAVHGVAIITSNSLYRMVVSAMAVASSQEMKAFDSEVAARAWLEGLRRRG